MTIGSGVGLQNQPVRCVMRINELMHQPRPAHPRFTADRHHLSPPPPTILPPPAHLLLSPTLTANLLLIITYRSLHPKRSISSPYRMILMGDRRAEEGHNPVTHHPVDSAFVSVD